MCTLHNHFKDKICLICCKKISSKYIGRKCLFSYIADPSKCRNITSKCSILVNQLANKYPIDELNFLLKCPAAPTKMCTTCNFHAPGLAFVFQSGLKRPKAP